MSQASASSEGQDSSLWEDTAGEPWGPASGGASVASLGWPRGLLHPRRQWPRVLPSGPLGDRPQHPAGAPGLGVAPSHPPQHTQSHAHMRTTPAHHPYTHTHHAPPYTRTVHTTHSPPTLRSEWKPKSSQHTPVTQHCMKGDLQRKGSPSRREISLLGPGADDTPWSRLVPAEGTVCVSAPRPTQSSPGAPGGLSGRGRAQTLPLQVIPNEVCPGNWGMRGQAR